MLDRPRVIVLVHWALLNMLPIFAAASACMPGMTWL
jgi:hypothetical protein